LKQSEVLHDRPNFRPAEDVPVVHRKVDHLTDHLVFAAVRIVKDVFVFATVYDDER